MVAKIDEFLSVINSVLTDLTANGYGDTYNHSLFYFCYVENQ